MCKTEPSRHLKLGFCNLTSKTPSGVRYPRQRPCGVAIRLFCKNEAAQAEIHLSRRRARHGEGTAAVVPLGQPRRHATPAAARARRLETRRSELSLSYYCDPQAIGVKAEEFKRT